MKQTEIFSYLDQAEPEMQREGAFMAGEAMCMEAIPRLAELLKSPNLGVQDAADMSLRKIGGKEVVDAVIPLLRSEDVCVRNLSMDILRQIGNQNIGPIIALLKDEDPDIRIFSSDILGSTQKYMAIHPLCESLLNDPEVNVRYQAAVSLGELGKPEATEALNKALDDDDWVNFAVIEALMKIGDDASINALIGGLDTNSELVASIIIDALGEIGNIKAVPVLIKYLDRSVPVLRNKILKAVVSIMGSKALSFLSEKERSSFATYLLVAADDEDTSVQDAAIVGLSCVGGERASRRILALIAGMDREAESERFQKALGGLVTLGLTSALEEGARSSDSRVSEVAVEVLIRLGTEKASQICMDIFWDKDRDMQRLIARGIGKIAGEEAKPLFVRILHDSSDGSILKSALTFLGVKMHFSDVAPDMIAFLDHRFDDVKEVALNACIALGGDVVGNIFVEMFHGSDPVRRMMAVYAFGKLDVRMYSSELEAALGDEVEDVRKIALEAMGESCTEIPEIFSRIVPQMMHDPSRDVRRSLIHFLGTSQCKEAVPFMIQSLEDEDSWVQIRAVEALGALRNDAMVPMLYPLLNSPNPLVPLKVIQALGTIGGKKAFQVLLGILEVEDIELQQAAEQALDKIQADTDEVF